MAALGSPPVSAIVPLPLRSSGGAATLGLDLAPHLAYLSGPGRPGTYLVGLRRLDASTQRSWMRLQVTDLVLTTVEEPTSVRFVVTSFSTGKPVAGAKVRIEGSDSGKWTTLGAGVSDAEGSFTWPAPGPDPAYRSRLVLRIVVQKDDDLLVLDPTRPPDVYGDNQWNPTASPWLQWALGPLDRRLPAPETLCHIFTERPVYRPEEEVHLKGYLRRREQGTLAPVAFSGAVVVQGPGDLVWRYPVRSRRAGQLLPHVPRGEAADRHYTAHFEDENEERLRPRRLQDGGLPPAALRGAAPRARPRAARPGVRRLAHR